MSQYSTSDISIAAYLLFKGMALISAERGSSKFKFTFSDPEKLGQKYVLEFASTPLAQFDAHLRTLRALIQR